MFRKCYIAIPIFTFSILFSFVFNKELGTKIRSPLKEILDEARQRLSKIGKDNTSYLRLLEGLITQGLFQLLEERVIIQCKDSDKDAVKVHLRLFTFSWTRDAGLTCNSLVSMLVN